MNITGLETLGLRMERICLNADKLAHALKKMPGISDVNYLTLDGNPYKELVDKQFGGKGGGILTFRAGSKKKAFHLLDSLKYVTRASNLGDVRTLAIHPASTLYIRSTAEQREAAGVFDDTIRISVGIEDADDLIEDFSDAIQQVNV